MRRILLVEPNFHNKYPPLGLMKISTYHQRRGDYVRFVKGCDTGIAGQQWDRIYVSSLFTFYWDITIRTVRFYSQSVASQQDIWIGGVMATLMGDEVAALTGGTVVRGLLNEPGQLDSDSRVVVDELTPDYSMLDTINYQYGLQDAYLGYATRGCPNRCDFCAVSQIEPNFIDYLPLKRQLKSLEMLFGERHDLVLMDNSVLASDALGRIVNDLVDLGYERGAKLNGRQRRVDFNQGTDVRLLTPEKMALLARTALRPLRLAFDDSRLRPVYEAGVRLAAENGVRHLSNYILFNYRDTPQDFYDRLRLNPVLNETLGTQIYSFPMKYVPLNAKDRSYVGKHWTPRLLRGVQCILVATRGMVGPHLDFFEAAFGHDSDEFLEIAVMPEDYIVHRRAHAPNGAGDWRRDFHALTSGERVEFMSVVAAKKITRRDVGAASTGRLKRLLSHYVDAASVDQSQLTLLDD
ncbi:hypothetical protein [Candidatus Cryosericum septentrionale]|jgi:hypothetical protein|uniref:hypothetical protein n=1 Tax=Candidatus Cryosericum septentrionale TaxID=2290913 RepID=UPI001A9E6923|nr:hypothetical protein [Candidatus Cryosericum septentrionale]